MKPIASTMTEVDHLPGDEVEFTISDANKAWVMRSMADLYSNRELACVREYSTNAYDSNKEKAIRDGHAIRPIRVTLPSALNPYFVVEDEGVGMDETTLCDVYTQFGESTKRDSDDFNGMLGFGSKSAVAYTNTFTITAVKDGHKVVAVVTRREDAMGGYVLTLKVVLRIETTESNGVTVQIPVHNWREFDQKARDFYRFWTPGTVLVNGVEPDWAVGDKIDDNLYYYPNAGTSYVVMGMVPYRITNPDALFPRGMNRISFVAYLDPCDCDLVAPDENGNNTHAQVEFTPAREDLKYSEHTKHHLHKIIRDFVAKSVETAKTEINGAANHAEAYKAWTRWRKIIGAGQVDDLSFKGDKLVEEFALDAMRYNPNAYRYGTYHVNGWTVNDTNSSLIVTEFDIALGSAHKKKVKDWLRMKGMSANYILFTAQKLNNPWIDPSRVVSWEKVKAEAPKPPRKTHTGGVAWGRKAGSFDLVSRLGRKNEQDVPQTKELYYIMTREYNARTDLSTVLVEFGMDHEVVIVPANRKDKFLRFYPHAKPVLAHLKSLVNIDGPSLISADGMEFLSLQANEASRLSKVDEAKVSDPEVKRLARICKKSEGDYLEEYNKQQRLSRIVGLYGQFKQHKFQGYWDRKAIPVSKRYPLFNSFSTHQGATYTEMNEHVYLYMNACYQARKDGKNV